MPPKAVLVGLPGSGKSTIGRRLARALDVTMLDTDAAIEQKTGRTIADIFATEGEQEFRRIEHDVVKAALEEHDGILALGGGAITTEGVRDALAGLVVVALALFAIPAVRRVLRARVSPIFGQVLPRLLEVAQHPRKLALGIGGALLLSLCYILCLAACVAAFGRSVPIASIGVVYLTGSAIGSLLPTPGGLGGVEAALTAGLTAAGIPGAVAVSAVLLFRLLTFWLPVPFGWAALSYLEREQAL